VLLAQQQPTEALALLEPLVVSAEQQARWYRVIVIKVLQALAHHMRDEERVATSTLAQALDLAEPEGYIRIFVDEGLPMAALLSRLRAQGPQLGPTTYLETLLAAYALDTMAIRRKLKRSEQRATSQSLLDPLSERELDVLQLIARGASNCEIYEEA
jgi:ATP/maltotriose-dependent transcriptional regulator MalT